MAGHTLIDAHLAALARRLPARAVDELADGLTETYARHLARGFDPTAAARAAIAEFGHPDQIITAFTRQAPGRRTALALLATGPGFAACWGPSLILGHAWTWPIPTPVALAFGLALLAVVAALVTAATSRHSYSRTQLAAPGAIGLVLLDTAVLAAVLLAAPTLVWPMALAIPASLARIGLTARTFPRLLAR
ncbi:MAG TPA: permease prefix domain 1-containing protein [Actinophytocola sp.]|uniref:permease prefix domain 1-containing protein n=1 Tax=Actinophytocola sp. TaxID=1872138 RepID=UPI002E02DCAC|nr:permease prefix domain 1-containing protein [Actinophytocola sp.]